MNMALVRFIKKLFRKNNRYSSLFSKALEEGIADTFKEMGYRFPNRNRDQ
jgi:hypothetical protein